MRSTSTSYNVGVGRTIYGSEWCKRNHTLAEADAFQLCREKLRELKAVSLARRQRRGNKVENTTSFELDFYIEDSSQVEMQFYGSVDNTSVHQETINQQDYQYQYSF